MVLREPHAEIWAQAFGLTGSVRDRQRQRYHELKEQLVFRIDAPGVADPLSGSLLQEDDEHLNGSDAGGAAVHPHPRHDDDTKPRHSTWEQYFNEESLVQEINTDLDRLYPAGYETFFQNETMLDLLRNVLFVWCKLHPDVSYRQGMHDVAAVVLFSFLLHRPMDTPFGHGTVTGYTHGSNVAQVTLRDKLHGAQYYASKTSSDATALPDQLEADVFLVFEAIMMYLKPFYEIIKTSFSKRSPRPGADQLFSDSRMSENDDPNSLFGPTPLFPQAHQSMNGVSHHDERDKKEHRAALHRLCHHVQYELLRQKDPQLYFHLQNMDIVPETYCLRWIRLLFAREFPMHQVLAIWDGMICDPTRAPIVYQKNGQDDCNIGSLSPSLALNTPSEPEWYGFPLLRFLCVAKLVKLAPLLRKADNTGCLRLLMHSCAMEEAEFMPNDVMRQDASILVRFSQLLQDPYLEASSDEDVSVVKFAAGSLGIILTVAPKPFMNRIAVKDFVSDPTGPNGRGQAEASEKVQIGDLIESINGVPVAGMSTEDVKRHIELIGRPLFMSFRHHKNRAIGAASSDLVSDNDSVGEKQIEILDALGHFLPGEKCYANVEASIQRFTLSHDGSCLSSYLSGKLYITNYRCLFARLLSQNEIDWQVPLLSITSIEGSDSGSNLSSSGSSIDHAAQIMLGFNSNNTFKVVLRCKDTQVARFSFSHYAEYSKLVKCLSFLAFPSSLLDAFCFSYAPEVMPSEEVPFDIRLEYQRIGLLENKHRFRCIDQTSRYELCESYPQHLIVPSGISDLQIKASALFRSHGRIPVVSWLNSSNGATISRSSQPLVGLKSNRCTEDELLVRQLCCSSNHHSFGRYLIMDARGQLAVVGNKAMGKGTEIPSHYRGAKIVFMNIDNIHAIRQSFQSLTALFEPRKGVQDDGMSFYGRLESSGWLRHVRLVLRASVELAQSVINGISVLTHCSDGWDRTAQMVSLAELMLDRHYRTMRGFQSLIEKEWCAFGHQFAARCGHARSDASNDQRSPVFLLWLDCVWQFMRQCPSEFEFSERLLLALADHVYSCKYGTFMFDTERQRKEFFAKHRVFSIWSEINSHSEQFLNSAYAPSKNASVLLPSTLSKNIKLWKGYFCRWDPTMIPPVPAFSTY